MVATAWLPAKRCRLVNVMARETTSTDEELVVAERARARCSAGRLEESGT